MADLHPQLEKDCLLLGQFKLCKLLLMKDANYPWFILVPDRQAVTEIYQLDEQDQQQLMRESSIMAKLLVEVFSADKVNIAALGNVVPQLHVHHVARYHDDPAWPAPVWGACAAQAYDDEALQQRMDKILSALQGLAGFSVAS
ncbi:MAG: HIT family protein [Gammaproteobacteria bacterium]|nr:HIT family protein [Gammaproteobacteria bacterium]